MIKEAVVRLGSTPSVDNGAPSKAIVKGEAVSEKGLNKSAVASLPHVPIKEKPKA